MPLDHYFTLGHSGLRVSPLCLGAMTFGEDWGFGSDLETSRAVLHAYLDAGGNFIDTANIYTKGHAEAFMGDELGVHASKRDRVVIATKFQGNLYNGDPNGGGGSRKTIMESCEQSLRRLRTDYIDLYWMHWWDAFTPIEETMQAMDDLVRAGKVRYIGFSDTPAWKCAQAQTMAHFRGWAPLIALQIEYSLVERTVEGDLIPMAQELGLGVTPWSPLRGGLLTGKFTRDDTKGGDSRREWLTNQLNDRVFGIIDAVLDVAGQLNVSAAQVALAWVRQRAGVTSTIIGARTLEHLEANLASIDVTLSDEQMTTLNEASVPTLNFPAGFLDRVAMATQGGTTINGRAGEVWPMAPASDEERW